MRKRKYICLATDIKKPNPKPSPQNITPGCKQEPYKHERVRQLAKHKPSRHAGNRPLRSHQLRALGSPSCSTLGWAPPRARLALGNPKSSTDLPCRSSMATSYDHHKGPLWLLALKSWRDVFCFGKSINTEMIFLNSAALLLFQETVDRRM